MLFGACQPATLHIHVVLGMQFSLLNLIYKHVVDSSSFLDGSSAQQSISASAQRVGQYSTIPAIKLFELDQAIILNLLLKLFQ